MFNNIGNKIKGYVKTIFYVNLVAILLLMVAVIIYAIDDYEYLLAIAAMVVGVLYILMIYIGMMCVYAIGEITQNTTEQTAILRKMVGDTPVREKDTGNKPEYSVTNRCKACGEEIDKDAEFCRFCGVSTKTTPVPTPVPTPAPVPDMPTPGYVPKPTPTGARKVVCPHCGAKQMEGTTTCKYCGTSMK